MDTSFNLENYLSSGVEDIVRDAIKATLSNPQESLFLAKYALASKKSRNLRRDAEKRGEHIPPFLIASITSKCNLHCAGCYARSNHACHDEVDHSQMTAEEWLRIFNEAKKIGVGFILLAGGEPMMRADVIKCAGQIQEIIFPIFTNGTMFNKEYLEIFSKYRNLIPVLSIEGDEAVTDQRRGAGVYEQLINTMDLLDKKKIVYGASVTVTRKNLKEVMDREFLDKLYKRGCKMVTYVEFVPVEGSDAELAPQDEDRDYMEATLLKLRSSYDGMIFISFPGDEKTSGGCLAAGRGFFHINPNGGAEPCPFSPYSDTNLKHVTLMEALNSPLFRKLRDGQILMTEHTGGCVLYDKKDVVEGLLA